MDVGLRPASQLQGSCPSLAAPAGWDAMTQAYPFGRNETLRSLLERRTKEDPARTFCRYEGRSVTLGELNSRANRIANSLYEAGLRRGERVAIMMANHPDHI